MKLKLDVGATFDDICSVRDGHQNLTIQNKSYSLKNDYGKYVWIFQLKNTLNFKNLVHKLFINEKQCMPHDVAI